MCLLGFWGRPYGFRLCFKLIFGRVFLDDDLADLFRRLLFFFLQTIGQQCFIYADGTLRSVIVDETGVETFMSKRLVAVTITRKLRQGAGNLFSGRIGLTGFAKEFLSRQRGWKITNLRGVHKCGDWRTLPRFPAPWRSFLVIVTATKRLDIKVSTPVSS